MWAIGIALLAGCVLLNVNAYMHAYRMTHFVSEDVRTSKPEAFSFFQKVRVLLTGIILPY